jgi:hypothetical protein
MDREYKTIKLVVWITPSELEAVMRAVESAGPEIDRSAWIRNAIRKALERKD